jgi:hypothetical protein
MFNEAENFAIVQTELDTVYFQNFEYDSGSPGIATANTGMIFKPVETTHAAYIGQINKGTGLYKNLTETQTIPLSTPAVRNKYTILVNDWGDGIEISKNLFDDNMHGVWAEDVRQFALMGRVTQDYNAFGLFRGAFTTTLTADGVSFINTAHVTISGAIVNNFIPGALDPTTLNDGIVALRTQKNQAGVTLGGTPTILLVAPENFINATQLTESALVSDSGNNALNVFRSAYGITVYMSPFLSPLGAPDADATAWFLMTPFHSVSRLLRQGIETALRPWQYSTNRTYFYQANFRESYFVPDYGGAVGGHA